MTLKAHAYQEKGIDFWLANPRTYFAVDMGLGKTYMVLKALTKIKRPALIVAPLRTIYTTWPDEIKKWNLPLTSVIVHGKDKELALNAKVDVYLTNFESIPFVYDTVAAMFKRHERPHFRTLVIDEGSKVKSHKTKRFDYLKALCAIFPGYRAILSGTPAPNSLLDLWSQYYLLDDGEALGRRYSAFKYTHYEADPYNPYASDIKEGAEEQIYKAITPLTFRLDAKDHLKLPEQTFNYIPVTLSKKLMKHYHTLKRDFIVQINDVNHITLNAASLSMKLRQFLQGFMYYETEDLLPSGLPKRAANEVHTAKVQALKSLVEELNKPLLCAIQFHHELKMIRKVFPDVPCIASGTSMADSTLYVKQWNKGQIPLLLCHPASLSHGMNLQDGGSNILWYCNTWSLEQYQQLNKRLHRQGQTKKVFIHHLIVAKTIDDRVTKVLAAKDMTQQRLLDYLKENTDG